MHFRVGTVPRQQQCRISSATSATVPCQQCTSAVPRQQQYHVSSATSANSATVPCQQCPATMTGSVLGMPGQLANESIAEYRQRFETQLALIAAEEQRQLAAEAIRLQAEAAATAEKQRLLAEAVADTQARHKEAQDLLQRHEATSIEKLKFWHFEPSEGHDDATPEEQHKEFMAKLVTRLVYTCNHLQSELANLQRAVRNHKAQHEDAARTLDSHVQDLEQTAPRPEAGESSTAPSARQLEERVDHVVAMLGDISTFAAPATISNQLDTLKTEVQQLHQLPNKDGNTVQRYKMPTFQIEKFDDYTHQDPVLWWEGFTTQLRILFVAKHAYISALFLNSKGGCQIWLSHLATVHGVDVAYLKDKISWEELTRLWTKRFIVDDAPALAINHLFAMTQGNTSTRDWLTEWQKIAATPDLDLPFSHLRREFYNRSCAALSLALGDCEQYATFAEIIDTAREIIKTNRAAAHEKSAWQPTYVEKVKTGLRPQHVAAVQLDNIVEDPAATQASCEGDQVAAVQPRSNNKSQGNGKAKTASPAGNGQPAPWVKFHLTEAEYKWRGRYGCCYWCNSTKHKTSQCPDQGKEDVRPPGVWTSMWNTCAPFWSGYGKPSTKPTATNMNSREELEYLGHYVTPQGIRPLADKIEALRVWPEPTNTTDVRSFMGLAGYYQRFITGYSRIVAPMTRLQSPKVPFVFDDDACRSFQALKTAMLMAPVLSIYDPTLPGRVTTDASGYGIGAVLEQHDGDDWHPVEYFSHKVPPINSLDDARKKELLVFVMALKRWRHFLLRRRRFTWVTDNNPLTYYKTQDTVSSTIGRWMYFINQFDFTPKHLPDLSNRAADALSRRPDLCAMTHHAFAFDEELQQHFIRGYESNPDFATLYAQLSSDHPLASHYRIVGGYVLLHSRGKDLLCVPRDRRLRTRLVGEYHDSRLAGNFGVPRTIARLRQRFRWPDLITDVTRYCDSCEVCRRSKPRNHNSYGELRPMPIPQEPGLSIAMDVTGPFPRDRPGHDGILMIVDRLIEVQLCLLEDLQNLLKVLDVLFHGLAENQDVIEVNNNKPVKLMAENLVHEALKCGWCIRKTEGHNDEFVQPIACLECSFVLVAHINFNLVVTRFEVDLGEDLAPTCSI
ncbi:hypothetical protein CBR_g49327 [Chara braunii]|uniref:Integrase zinc-binding domain-containing protein n=1 Tax=Chara braunii TaxID=69332 RepID=A0A388M4N0_CHABU|nr:hypothetical protein CBR_g49327 [Chara braunii]|eukprot:GBG89537.1 hypothetical protein CBR_g49327 [Chara braunii]